MVIYFLSLSSQIEKLLKICFVFLFVGLLLSQLFILSDEEHQALVNQSIRYEGVFQEDPVQAKATLQRR